ncbi:MAG: UvrD-helicase domain-containing protein [Hyphomicrobiales bacterium]
MSIDAPDPLLIDKGCIQAPAGCGKTYLIADSLKRNSATKPILVLTHTNAAVAALRKNLDQAKVPRANYRLATIDGWAMRIIGMFPFRSSATQEILSKPDYPAIKDAALKLLSGRHIDNVLGANYSRLLVDEYQDCLQKQHALICELARILPTCVFGDVLQGIFDFGDTPVNWNHVVLRDFPLQTTLGKPWRWDNAGCGKLGQWLLSIRPTLEAGGKIDLEQTPPELEWVRISGPSDFQQILKATHQLPDHCSNSIIVCDGMNKGRQHDVARKTKGAATIENADLSDLTAFAKSFDFTSVSATEVLIEQATKLLRNLGSVNDLVQRYRTLKASTNHKPPTEAEHAILAFDQQRSPRNAAGMLSALGNQSAVSPFRREVFSNLLKALNSAQDPEDFYDMAVRAREERRFHSRSLGKISVGSTLLVKGLEADQVVIVDAECLNPKNLYVALTRGAKRIVVCSQAQYLPAV